MKALLVLFSIIFVIENFVIANNDFSPSPLLKDLYQKKTKNSFMSGPKLVNKRISMVKKMTYGTINKAEIRTKKTRDYGEYTVFPSHLKKEPIDVPSSPYFSGDPHNDEPKLRVKKVLPDFWNVHDRKKRSPEGAVKDDAKKDSEVKAVNETKAEADKAETPVATSGAVADKASTSVATSKDPKDLKDEKKVEAKDATKNVKQVPATAAKASKPKVPGKLTPKNPSKPASRNVKSKKLPAKRNSAIKKTKLKSKSKQVKRLQSNLKKSNTGKRSHANKAPVKRSRPNNKTAKRSRTNNASGKHAQKNKKALAKTGKEIVSRRLIAGQDAMIENYPYVVSIQKDGEHWCAGALLNQRLVITTANCVWKSSRMSRMKIRAGSRHLEHGGQLVEIAEVLKHPAWSIRKNPDYDVALLLTDGYVKFSHKCHAVDLPNRIMMPIFDDAWIVSWGAERRDGVYVKQGLTLQVYHARLQNHDQCNNITLRFGVMVTENFICLEQIGRRAPCTRDTGAPAVSDGILWGLASWGIRKMCGTERFPAMFSYIASESNMDFIINGTRYLMSEERLSPFLDRYPFPRSRNYSSRIL